MLGRIGTTELLLALGLVLIIFGPRKLPEIGRFLGKGLREFKESIKEVKEMASTEENVSEDKNGKEGI